MMQQPSVPRAQHGLPRKDIPHAFVCPLSARLMHDAVHAVRQRVGEREGSGGGAGGATGGRPSAMAIGHAGVGGSIGLCIPERRVALAITVSKLSGGRTATKKILELLLAEVGLAAPVGL